MPPETKDSAKPAARGGDDPAPPAPPPPPRPRGNVVRKLINAVIGVVLLAAVGGGGWSLWSFLANVQTSGGSSGVTIDLPEIKTTQRRNMKEFYSIRVTPTLELDPGLSPADVADLQIQLNARTAQIIDKTRERIRALPEVELLSNDFDQRVKEILMDVINNDVFKPKKVVSRVWIKNDPDIQRGQP